MSGQTARLKAENRQLREKVAELEDKVCRLDATIARLEGLIEQLRQQGSRQAAPFRRDDSSKVHPDQKKLPGRRKGHPGSCRREPETIDETVCVPLDACPCCGEKLSEVTEVTQIIEELPVVRPKVTKVITYRGRCARCGEVDSRHPLQTSTATGCAGVQLGPMAQSYAVALNKQYGLTMRNACRVLQELMGLSVTPGGLSQIAARAARKVDADYQELFESLRQSAAVFADETSWWVGGPGWWLWTFTEPQTTAYLVERRRGSAVVEEVLGDYKGMLVSDCLSSYDPPEYRKHKCIAHHLRAISEQMKVAGEAGSQYLAEWKVFFISVMALYKARDDMPVERFALSRDCLESKADELLGRAVGQAHDVSIRNRLQKQRKHLLGCLYEPAAEPTNNRAERSLRPAVIARKVSCGNKTVSGKQSWQKLVSLAVTCRQRSQNFTDFLAQRLTLPQLR